MASKSNSKKALADAKTLYETKQKAASYYAQNGVPQKMEDVLNSMFYENPADVYGHLANYFETFAKAPAVTKVLARQALDSKCQPTVQTEVYCRVKNNEKLVCTSLSSSYNTHLLESARPEEKDQDDKEREESVTAAVNYLNTDISNRLQGLDATNQSGADGIVYNLIELLKKEEDERLAQEAAEQEPSEEPGVKSVSPSSKPKSAKGKDKDKGRGKGGGKGAPAVVVTPAEPLEKFLKGSMCVSAVSQAVCQAGAAVRNMEVFEYVAQLKSEKPCTEFRVPLPMVTILQSGRAAPGKLNCIKEFMVVPKPGKSLKETLPQILAIYNHVARTLVAKSAVTAKNVNDIGALMFAFDRAEQGLDMIQDAISQAGLTPGEDFYIALNCAGHEIFDYDKPSGKEVAQSFPLADKAAEKGKYELVVGSQKVADDVVEFWAELMGRYPSVIALIDPLRKQEDVQWMTLCDRISEKCFIMGDHVYHRPGKLKDETLLDTFKSSGVVFRLEQMNTISDILQSAKKMEEAENEVVLSTCVGETTDTFLTDMAVGMNTAFVKVGAPCRGERVAKLNRLLQIEEMLQSSGRLATYGDFKFPHIVPPPPPEPAEGEGEEAPAQEDTKKDAKKK